MNDQSDTENKYNKQDMMKGKRISRNLIIPFDFIMVLCNLGNVQKTFFFFLISRYKFILNCINAN